MPFSAPSARSTRVLTATRTALAGLVTAAVLAGCASPSSGPGRSSGPGGTTAPVTSLQVRLEPGTSTAPTTWTLTCDPAGGTHPQAVGACAQLEAAKADPFAETPAGVMCSMIYGGAQIATVTGTFKGHRVDTRFARTNGCEVARWQIVSVFLGLPGLPGAPAGGG